MTFQQHTAPRLLSILVAAAGTISTAHADMPERLPAQVGGTVTQAQGHVYINNSTGERIISSADAGSLGAVRGTTWSWDNSVTDGCTADQDQPLVVSIFTGVHSRAAGDASPPDASAISYWSDWMEVPGDSIVKVFTFGYFSQIIDPGEDGVVGSDFLFTFTENDRINARSGAIAHSPILVEELFGAEDDGADGAAVAGDGIIDFAEGNYWIISLDLEAGDTPTDLELADTNGVSDGDYGVDSIFSGVPAVDTNSDGLFNVGYYIGFRQPNVSEGDGLLIRFPELANLGLENPDGLDAGTFPNIEPMGVPLVFPSAVPESYDFAGPVTWPQVDTYVPAAGEATGSTDAFAQYDAVGVEVGVFAFCQDAACTALGMGCDENATAAPFYLAPWAAADIRLNVIGFEDDCFSLSCNFVSCYGEPYDVIDLADITGFILAFLDRDDIADISPAGSPDGVWDLADLTYFVTAFQAGCP